MIKVLHDPSNGPLDGVITWGPEQPTVVDFRAQTGERCGRCNRVLPVHVWQLVDTEPAEEAYVMQRGVVDCGIVEAAA
jgi:hypothetical protein